MATLIIGSIVALMVALVAIKMIRDKRAGKGGCSCGGDCSRCHGACASYWPEPK